MKLKLPFSLLFLVCSALFLSCSSDNTNTINETPILIKKITETVYYSGQQSDIYISNFSYENNVLKSISNDNIYKIEFVYSGDKIIKANYFKNSIADGFTAFFYVGDLLSYTLSGDFQDEKTEYLYTNGVLSSVKSGYLNGTNYIVQETLVYLFNSEKNATQLIKTSSVFGPKIISKEIYSYDNKNSPMKDMNKYFRFIYGSEGFDGLTANNIVSRESYYPIESTTPNYCNYEIVYNNDNFPTEIKKIATQSKTLISKTIVEYY